MEMTNNSVLQTDCKSRITNSNSQSSSFIQPKHTVYFYASDSVLELGIREQKHKNSCLCGVYILIGGEQLKIHIINM